MFGGGKRVCECIRMQEGDLYNTDARFPFYWQTHSTVLCHHLADIFLSVTRLVREKIVKHTAGEPISLQSEIEPNIAKKILYVSPSIQKNAGFHGCLTSAIWYNSTLALHTSKKGRIATLMRGCKYMSFLPVEELLEVIELYFILKLITYAQKEQEAQI